MISPMDGPSHIGKKVKLNKNGLKSRIPHMKKWIGRIYDYDPHFDQFFVCWIEGDNTHHFKEHYQDLVILND